MKYSVFDWNGGAGKWYIHFEDTAEHRLGTRPTQATFSDEGGKGHKLEDLLPEVPASAHYVGRSDQPRGRIARLSGSMKLAVNTREGLSDDNPLVSSPWLTLGLWTGAVYLAYKGATWLGLMAAKVK